MLLATGSSVFSARDDWNMVVTAKDENYLIFRNNMLGWIVISAGTHSNSRSLFVIALTKKRIQAILS